MRTFLKYWLPVFIWLGVIFAGSTDIFSTEQTSRYLVPFLRWLDPQISLSTIATIHFALRKIGHLTEFDSGGLFLAGAAQRKQPACENVDVVPRSRVACVIIAASDELHQSLVASRTASLNDVFTDSLGAAIGLAICLAIAQRDAKKLEEPIAKS